MPKWSCLSRTLNLIGDANQTLTEKFEWSNPGFGWALEEFVWLFAFSLLFSFSVLESGDVQNLESLAWQMTVAKQ